MWPDLTKRHKEKIIFLPKSSDKTVQYFEQG